MSRRRANVEESAGGQDGKLSVSEQRGPNPSSIKSAERVMDVLRFLATRVRPVPSMTIARHCELPRSSTYHLLNCMREQQFVTYYPEDHAWGLGASAFEIGSAYLRSEPLSWLGRPLLRDIASTYAVTAHLAVLHGQDALYVVKEAPSAHGALLVSRVGVRLPAHLTAVGRAILMSLPRAQLRAIYTTRNLLVRRTRRGPQLVSELERELQVDRERSFALDVGMTTPNITCAASPVFSHENLPIAGLGVTFPTDQPLGGDRDKLIEQVQRNARELSVALGWTEGAD